MSKITIDRAVVEQALGALVRAELMHRQPNQSNQDALRAVLEQPQVEQEPVEVDALKEQRNELLEALKTLTAYLGKTAAHTSDLEVVWDAEKVIRKATGEQA